MLKKALEKVVVELRSKNDGLVSEVHRLTRVIQVDVDRKADTAAGVEEGKLEITLELYRKQESKIVLLEKFLEDRKAEIRILENKYSTIRGQLIGLADKLRGHGTSTSGFMVRKETAGSVSIENREEIFDMITIPPEIV